MLRDQDLYNTRWLSPARAKEVGFYVLLTVTLTQFQHKGRDFSFSFKLEVRFTDAAVTFKASYKLLGIDLFSPAKGCNLGCCDHIMQVSILHRICFHLPN